MRAGFALTPEQIHMFRDGLYNYPANIGYSDASTNPYTAVAPLAAGIAVVQPPDISSGKYYSPDGNNLCIGTTNISFKSMLISVPQEVSRRCCRGATMEKSHFYQHCPMPGAKDPCMDCVLVAFEVSMSWKEGAIYSATVRALRGGHHVFCAPKGQRITGVELEQQRQSNKIPFKACDNGRAELEVTADRTYKFQFSQA
jgi:hypothetical protein